MKRSLAILREVLLIEIERRCALDAECNQRIRIGLTKEEARAYCGFKCERCERWNDDALTERDVPEWWEEIAVTGLTGLRAAHPAGAEEPGEVVTRLSDNYRKQKLDESSQSLVETDD